jgi:hypothetical protein
VHRSSFICQHCAEPIGVYEPVFVMTAAESRLTSRAAEPDLPPDGRYLHRACAERSEIRPADVA